MPVASRRCRLAVALIVVTGLVGLLAPAAGAEVAGTYAPPVDRPLVDRFRAPANPYAAGNRGVDYATRSGDQVRAAAGGEVTFAGRVGVELHVVVLHADGLRTSYSFLAEVQARRGDRVEQGTVLGSAGAALHFGVRVGDRYLDPLGLFGATGPVTRPPVPPDPPPTKHKSPKDATPPTPPT
ncbi:hypothetical protein BH18ACT1_BH18ACT1_17690 [soil metagenome]